MKGCRVEEQRRFMDGVNEDMKVAAVKEEDAQNRLK